MRVPIGWLREYVEAGGSPPELAKRLLMAGTGIEGIEGEVLDLEITSNRADLLSILGVAREVAVLTKTAVREPEVKYAETAEDVAASWKVEVSAPDLCPRYTARVVRGVKVGPSPKWLAERLEAAGVRSVNNVVDVTNHVLLEFGQPLHAFDTRLLRGGKVVVRRAAEKEKIVAIDGLAYDLQPGMLVIADAARAVAIAGVMGGRESEIGPQTVDVLIESAQFDPVSIRRTSRRLGLASESSYRFERGVDFETVDRASRRAVQLVLEVAGGRALRGVVDVSVAPPPRPTADVRPSRVRRVLGMEIPESRIFEILSGLGCAPVRSGDALKVTAPARRRDLRIEADYIEEIARIEGYDKVPCDTRLGQRVAEDLAEDVVREEVRSALTGLGCFEVLTWSFAEAGTPNRAPFWTEGPLIPLRDPWGKVERTLRESLAPGLLEVLATNESYKEDLRPVFEIAHVYRREDKGYGERTVLGVAAPGDPLGAKGLLEALSRRIGIDLEFVPSGAGALGAFLAPGSSAEVRLAGRTIGYLGAPGSSLPGPRAEVGIAEVDFEALFAASRLIRPYRDFHRQPPVSRDLSVVVAEGRTWRELHDAVRAAAPPTLEAVRFLSEYRGKGIEAGQKGLAFSMTFRAAERTMTGAEIEAAVAAVVEALGARFGARLR